MTDPVANSVTASVTNSPPRPPALRRLIWALWVMAAITCVFAALLAARMRSAEQDLPVLRQLPDFELTNRDGRGIGLGALAGKPFVADFVFTHCPGVCPILSERMQALSDELNADGRGERVNLVSISVDPGRDTPEVLADYAARHGAGANWFFLTGGRDAIRRLVVEGFQLVLDDSERQAAVEAAASAAPDAVGADGEAPNGGAPDAGDDAGKEPIVHSNRFVLVDGAGRIRGYYNAFDAEELANLRRDLDRLL